MATLPCARVASPDRAQVASLRDACHRRTAGIIAPMKTNPMLTAPLAGGTNVTPAPGLVPQDYPRRVLVLVTGLSPQVVTETLFALSVQRRPAFVPTELHVLTTTVGAERVRLALLSDEPGWLARLQRDWQLPPLAFGPSHIHIIQDAAGDFLTDLRTEKDNEYAADFIIEKVRQFSLDPACALHASIAGGRKTMGYFLGYALSLYGRPQDRLSHVLVTAQFEHNAEFFYPSPKPRVIQVKDLEGTKPADASEAKVMLAEIPFVRLRNDLPQMLLEGRSSFSATVEAAQFALQPHELILQVRNRLVTLGGQNCYLAPEPMAVLLLLARRQVAGLSPLPAPPKEVGDEDLAQAYLSALRDCGGPLRDLERAERAVRNGMDGSQWSSKLSRLRRVLGEELGPAGRLLIDDGGRRSVRNRYSLVLPASRIQLEP